MLHLKENIFCVIDVETTGVRVGYHEVCQICILPVTNTFEVDKSRTPLYLNIKPEYPERVDPQAMKVNNITMRQLAESGIGGEASCDIFYNWFNKIVPVNKYGYKCKIVPIGHNYSQFDKHMVTEWLNICGYDYDEFFHYHARDTQTIAAYINDLYGYNQETPPFNSLSLDHISKKFGLENRNAHDALGDCMVTAQIYKKLMTIRENQFGAL